MNSTTLGYFTPWRLSAALSLAASLAVVAPAAAQFTVTGNSQLGTSLPFTPTWTPVTGGLLDGLVPTSSVGDFAEYGTGGNVNNLTAVGESIQVRSYAGAGNLEMCGDDGNATTASAGRNVVYTLPAGHVYGYNITNIAVYGGWQDAGRDAQAYTILYSTVADPARFFVLTTVVYNPPNASGSPSATRVTVNDAAGGPIATNVAALKFDFASMGGENRSAGYMAITAFGAPATGPVTGPGVVVTGDSQTGGAPFVPSWTIETPNLIAGQSPTVQSGDFTGGAVATDPATQPNVLTDGNPGTYDDIGAISACGPSAGGVMIYTLTNNTVNTFGEDVTNIVVYNGWSDGGRDGQYYTVSYSTVSSPSSFIPITTVFYSPDWNGNAIANRVAVRHADGTPLAVNVASLKFDFSSPTNAGSFYHGFQGYGEFVVQGANSLTAPTAPPSPLLAQDILPSYAETVAGDQVVFTAAYTNSVPAVVQWQQIVSAPPATNNLTTGVVTVTNNGVVISTLTLNNVQPGSSGTYWLEAINATNSLGVAYSSPAPLVVSNLPAAVNNVIFEYAGQCGPLSGATSFTPAWTVDVTKDMIYGFPTDGSGNPGTATAGNGNFGKNGANADPTLLTDGVMGAQSYAPAISQTLVSCGIFGSGDTMTYTLDTSSAPNGFDLTNIVVYGGWSDSSHNEQLYQVLYSTKANPGSFVSLGIFDYNPNGPAGVPSATRTSLVPGSGALARGVGAVRINWNLQNPSVKNGSGGYSEIIVRGAASPPVPVLVTNINPATAEDVVGSRITLTASFTGATSYQWQKNGTNLPGATTSNLTLSNLQLSDAGTYNVVASNNSGSSQSGGCVVTVDPAPAAVGNIIKSIAIQTESSYVGPTWDVAELTNSLIYQQNPPQGGFDPAGNFNDPDTSSTRNYNTAGGLPILTDGSYGVFSDVNDMAFASCGPGGGAGQYVIYTLPSTSTNGYNLTNIVIAGGWNDWGRETMQYTVKYSTVANPTTFVSLLSVKDYPAINSKIEIRETFKPVNGVLASNVAAVYVDFTQPPNVPNGWSGISEIAVFGSPSAGPEPVRPPNTVLNPSFEMDVAPGVGQGITSVPSYWAAFNEAGGGDIGSQNSSPAVYSVNNPMAAPAAGNQFCYVNMFDPNVTGGIYQDIGPLQPNTTYTLTVAIGSRLDRLNSPGIISLLNGADSSGTVLVTGGGLPATQNTWQDYSVTFTSGASVSGDLTVALSVLGNATTIQADFDNVRLSVAPVMPVIAPPKIVGGQLILTGAGGVANSPYTWLSTTNLTPPIVWITNVSASLDASGAFSNNIPVDSSAKARFYWFRQP